MKSFYIAGYGNTGESAARALSSYSDHIHVIDRVEPEDNLKARGVEFIQGDALNEELWKGLSLEPGDTVILALPDDASVIFSTLIVRNLYPEVTIIARTTDFKNLGKIYRAGADYGAPISSITSHALSMYFLKGREEGEVSFSYSGISIERVTLTPRSELVGKGLGQADIEGKTGCIVIAMLDQLDEVLDLNPEMVLREGMKLLVAGKKENLEDLKKMV